MFPMRPGVPARQSHDYKRNGTRSLYASLNEASGKVITELSARHRAVEFRRFLDLIDTQVPDDLDVHLVLDNVSTHKTPAIKSLGSFVIPASRSTSRRRIRRG